MASFRHYKVSNTEQTPVIAGTTEPLADGKTFLQRLEENMKIKIQSKDKEQIVFDLVGVDASIANALRRIMIAEVPTMAIETVYIQMNTSIIQDEVLSHRLGLIPLNVDPSLFESISGGEEPTDLNTLVFKLDVTCNEPTAEEMAGRDPDATYTMNVYSKHLEWQPQGNQAERFPDGIAPVHPDILVAMLRQGQQIQLELHCVKGVGKDHAKFSPVATASYRLLPEIHFKKPVTGERAAALKKMCPLDVFDIEDMGGSGDLKAVAARPRDCTMCRECIRTDDWSDYIELRRISDHFIFSVESVGCLAPERIVRDAIQVLKAKAVGTQKLVVEYEGSSSK